MKDILCNQEQLKYWVTMDERKLHSKPDENFRRTITRNLTKRRKLTIPEFARLVSQPFGYTWSGGRFEGKRSNATWMGQQVFALDFDKGTTTVNEVIETTSQFGFKPQLCYYTFSDSPELRKFRMVFFLDNRITDVQLQTMIYNSLMSMFPDADKSCKDASRYFYGGKECEIIHTDPISTPQFIDALSIQLCTSDSGKLRKLPLESDYYSSMNSVSKRTFSYYNYSNSRFQTESNSAHTSVTPDAGRELVVIDIEKTRTLIRILDEFLSGSWLPHMELFGLATNLVKIKGGYQLMKKTMEKYNQEGKTKYTQNNFNILPYVKKMNYYMVPIHKFSPYPEDNDLYDVISSTRNIRGLIEYEPFPKMKLEQAEELFSEKFQEVINNGELGKIYLFSMPTAIGKTERLFGANAIIALPTNDLKNEIADRFTFKNSTNLQDYKFTTTPDTVNFESMELSLRQQYYYTIGLPTKSMEMLYNIVKPANSEDNSEYDIMAARNYLSGLQKSFKSKDSILTTHKRALFTEFTNDTLIFDEDPLSSLLEIKQLNISDLFLLNQHVNDPEIDQLIKYLIEITPNLIVPTPIFNFKIDHLIKIISHIQMESNVFEFFKSSFFMRGSSTTKRGNIKKHDTIYYINKLDLPENKKVIILSATIPIPIYKLLFGERIVGYDIRDVQQQGKIIQYTKRSCSRKGLKRYGNLINQEVGSKPVITFKAMGNVFQNPAEGIWFGNCSGYDHLKGQDIAVVGTPHRNPRQYLLMAKALKIDFKTTDTTMSNRKIEYNGFKFMMHCFDNDHLRSIQLSLIESDLIQAVGRARTLRTDAKVEVYSNFPLRISDEFIY